MSSNTIFASKQSASSRTFGSPPPVRRLTSKQAAEFFRTQEYQGISNCGPTAAKAVTAHLKSKQPQQAPSPAPSSVPPASIPTISTNTPPIVPSFSIISLSFTPAQATPLQGITTGGQGESDPLNSSFGPRSIRREDQVNKEMQHLLPEGRSVSPGLDNQDTPPRKPTIPSIVRSVPKTQKPTPVRYLLKTAKPISANLERFARLCQDLY